MWDDIYALNMVDMLRVRKNKKRHDTILKKILYFRAEECLRACPREILFASKYEQIGTVIFGAGGLVRKSF